MLFDLGVGGIGDGGLGVVFTDLVILRTVSAVSPSSPFCAGCSLRTSSLTCSSHDSFCSAVAWLGTVAVQFPHFLPSLLALVTSSSVYSSCSFCYGTQIFINYCKSSWPSLLNIVTLTLCSLVGMNGPYFCSHL